MNFVDFAFWWLLLLYAAIFISVRAILLYCGYGQKTIDHIGLLLISLALFYNAASQSFLIFFTEIILNYLVIVIFLRLKDPRRVILLIAIIVFDIGVLGYFKYFDFYFGKVVQNILAVIPGGNLVQIHTASLLPPGISFYTFQMIAFVIDSYRDREAPPVKFTDFVTFVAFFPQLVAGPIERRADLLPQIQEFRFKFDWESVEVGLRWVVLGLFMKLVLANNLASFIDLTNQENSLVILSSAYLFGLRIYFDFAGYSFIALGLGNMLGIRLTINFRFPYVSVNIREFWKRWHVTLSNWFRDYVYIPLGGSFVPWVVLNIIVVFAISGLWHGAGWNYVIWGCYHAMLLIIYRYGFSVATISGFLSWLLTYFAVMFGWLFFMETNCTRLLHKLAQLINLHNYSLAGYYQSVLIHGKVAMFTFVVVVILAHAELIREYLAIKENENRPAYLPLVSTSIIMLGALFLMTARGHSPFVYFAF